MPFEVYNGLGIRLTKSDPTGSYSYLNDGFSPASDVLTDGYSTFTPGISETKGTANSYASVFYLTDASGNSRGLLNGSGSATDGYNWDAFGNLVSRFGTNPTMFAWEEASGYQTDNDDGLTLLGHRYYDKRTGRFISQDHAKDGGNWYGYAGNDPMNETDPSGLSTGLPGTLGAPDQRYGGFVGSDPFELFGEQDNAGKSQTEIGQGAGQQAQGPALPSTDLISISQGMMHPAPIIIEDAVVSVSYGFSMGFGIPLMPAGFGRVYGGVGVAYDITTRQFELFRTGGVSGGFDAGVSLGLGFTIGNDSLGNFGGFNGLTNNYDILGSSHGLFGFQSNPSYKGLEFSPPGVGPFEDTNFGFEYGVSAGKSNTVPIFNFSLPTVSTLHF